MMIAITSQVVDLVNLVKLAGTKPQEEFNSAGAHMPP
jgi:hypothetical protein